MISIIGIHVGACVSLEKKLEKKLYSFACRHHVLELIPATIYNTLFGSSNGPGIPLFQRFQKAWRSGEINRNNWKSSLEDPDIAPIIQEFKSNMINFVRDQLILRQPRDDYEEYLILILHFCGEKHIKVTESDMSFTPLLS